jgi:hypothetical protein
MLAKKNCLPVSVRANSVTSRWGRDRGEVRLLSQQPSVRHNWVCVNRQHSGGRTGGWLCRSALALDGKSIIFIASLTTFFLNLSSGAGNWSGGPHDLIMWGGRFIIICDVTPRSHDCLLSQERNPVRKNTQQIFVFCTLSVSRNHGTLRAAGPAGALSAPLNLRSSCRWLWRTLYSAMERRVVWCIFTDVLNKVLPQSRSLNMLIPSKCQ